MFERHWLQNDLSAVCTENLITITRLARTFQSTRTRRCREQYMPLVTFCLRHFLADSIICMYVFDFRQAHQAIGRSEGGLSTKIHAMVDALGNPTAFFLTAGQAHDLEGADALLPHMQAETLLADKAFDADQRVIDPLRAAGKQF